MDSSRYLTPRIPDRPMISDMIVWYTTPEMRHRLTIVWDDDLTLMDELTDQAIQLLTTWSPQTPYDWSVVHGQRTIEWLVWRTAAGADESMSDLYTSVEMVQPWAVELSSLPRYGSSPTALVVE